MKTDQIDKKIEYEKNLLADIISSIKMHGGRDFLTSVILTGSFGREEPTYTKDTDGNLILKSDVEIALVYKGNKGRVDRLIKNVSSEFKEDLNLMPIGDRRIRKVYNFNMSFKTPKYKTIFTYDLYNGSKTIWGVDYIRQHSITNKDIDLFEAKRLIGNRIGELVYLDSSVTEVKNKEFSRIQWKGKIMLAIASAWLICAGEYVSSYHGQHRVLMKYIDKVNKTLGKDFIDEYNRVFCFLRENGEEYEVDEDSIRRYVEKADAMLGSNNIRHPKVNSISRKLKYIIKYIIKTERKYGILDFEERILHRLISEYSNADSAITETAMAWHNVLY